MNIYWRCVAIDTLSTKDFLNSLINEPTENIIKKLFEYFHVDCFVLQNLDIQALENLISKLKKTSLFDKNNLLSQIIRLFESACNIRGEIPPIAENVLEKLNENDEYLDHTLEEVLGIEKSKIYYISRIIKKNTGKTLNQYKNEMQITKSKNELLKTQKSITDIALQCGFCSASYFCKTFKKIIGVSPKEYRKIMTQENKFNFMPNATEDDKILFSKMDYLELTDNDIIENITKSSAVKNYLVTEPNEEFSFLHEAAIIKFEGKLFAAWYNNQKLELNGRTPIRFSTSIDNGKSWTEPKIVADDKSGKILYCPPVFGIQDGKLYMFLNQMVKPDYMHSLDLYIYDKAEDNFKMLWTRPIPFKLNTNVYTLPSGKLMLVGRVGELDKLPTIPAIMISDSGKIDAEWRLITLQENDLLPDGEKFVFPETSAIVTNENIYVFCRNDNRNVPILYISNDQGETWSKPIAHNIPLLSSKIYSGTLSSGRNYVIGNINKGREQLAIFFTEPNCMKFDKGILLQNSYSEEFKFGYNWHYPIACEADDKLYIIYTASYDETNIKRGAVISVINLSEI